MYIHPMRNYTENIEFHVYHRTYDTEIYVGGGGQYTIHTHPLHMWLALEPPLSEAFSGGKQKNMMLRERKV